MIEQVKYLIRTFGLEHFGRYYGIYKGFVEDNEDPDGLARLKLRVPQVYGKEPYDEWAYPKGVYAGKGYGWYNVPEVGDAVWVQFEAGDTRHPVWDFGWFASGEKVDGAVPKKKIFLSPAGLRIELDDENETIKLTRKDGTGVEIIEDQITALVNGGHKVVIKSGGVDIGKDDLHPAALADKWVTIFKDFITDLGLIQGIPVNIGAAVTLLNNAAPGWALMVQKYNTYIEEVKSATVKIEK
jgi:hypothetical protein